MVISFKSCLVMEIAWKEDAFLRALTYLTKVIFVCMNELALVIYLQ